jgi:hypothetical protein
MSRAKEYEGPDGSVWFDYKASSATLGQLVLLSDITGDDIDDLLDAGLSQREVARRLYAAEGLIPEHVLERRRQRLRDQANAPACRWCAHHGLICEGISTKHHFVPRWLMLLLENYLAYAPRSACTIPICLGRHRDLHQRDETPKSIVELLTEYERQFACRMLDELREQRPVVYDLLVLGDESSYEAVLVHEHRSSSLRRAEVASEEVFETSLQGIQAVGVASA